MDCEYGTHFISEVRSVLMTCTAAKREMLHSKRITVCGPEVERVVSVGPTAVTAHGTAHIGLDKHAVFTCFLNSTTGWFWVYLTTIWNISTVKPGYDIMHRTTNLVDLVECGPARERGKWGRETERERERLK
jgi:hypothetical protein